MNQEIFQGYGSIQKLVLILQKIQPKNIFLVTGKSSYISCGAESALKPILEAYKLTRFFKFDINPKLEDIEKGISQFQKKKFDLIIAIGGGSVIDTAKAIAILSEQDKHPEVYVTGKDTPKPSITPLVAIPTTAGTGSESTHFSVVYLNKTKYSLAHKSMLPNYAILDPTFTLTLSPKLTAYSGMDALCQAIESFWSIKSTEESRDLSKKALKKLLPNILQAVNNPNNNVRESMLIGSNLAGQAINIAKTTAAHAISYSFTTIYGVAHGHAVALTLPYFFPFNYNVDEKTIQDRRGIELVRNQINSIVKILDVNTPEEAQNKLLGTIQKIGLKTKLSELGIDEKIILKQGFNSQRAKNNPRRFSNEDFKKLLSKIK